MLLIYSFFAKSKEKSGKTGFFKDMNQIVLNDRYTRPDSSVDNPDDSLQLAKRLLRALRS
jgi:hypothetical protein